MLNLRPRDLFWSFRERSAFRGNIAAEPNLVGQTRLARSATTDNEMYDVEFYDIFWDGRCGRKERRFAGMAMTDLGALRKLVSATTKSIQQPTARVELAAFRCLDIRV